MGAQAHNFYKMQTLPRRHADSQDSWAQSLQERSRKCIPHEHFVSEREETE